MNSSKIIIITGSKSFQEINQIVLEISRKRDGNKVECTVFIAPVDVSAFIQPQHVIDILKTLPKDALATYNCVLLPGFIPWDAQDVSQKFNIPIYKGTRFSGDLYDLLMAFPDVKLSTTKPADSFLKNKGLNDLQKILETRTHDYFFDKKKYQSVNGNVMEFQLSSNQTRLVGESFPPLIFSEIVNAPHLIEVKLLEKVKYYIESGSDVVDIGTIMGQDNSDFIRHTVQLIKKQFQILVSIDSIDINELIAGIESGADFILSIESSNIDPFCDYIQSKKESKPELLDLGIVVIPLEGKNHTLPLSQQERFDLLFALAKKLHHVGLHNIFYDPLLRPPISPGIMSALYDYYSLGVQLKNTIVPKDPTLMHSLFMGFNNIFELIDADSSGIITMLSIIAVELSVGGVLTTEYSTKSLGAISETKKALDLCFLAKSRKSPPINLGIDAFSSKNKYKENIREETPKYFIEIETNKEEIKPEMNTNLPENLLHTINSSPSFIHDPLGHFKFYVDHLSKKIEVLFIPSYQTKAFLGINDNIIIKGTSAEAIYKVMGKLGLVSIINHAFYLGKELAKAELALKTHTTYVEDIDI